MRPGDTREQLIAAGLKTLHHRGFNASGVQDITDAARVPKGSFYNHFDSKEAFGAEVLGRYWERGDAHRMALLADTSRTPLERLKSYFEAKKQASIAGKFEWGCLIGNLSAEVPNQSRMIRDRLDGVFAAWTRTLATCIREAQEVGEISIGVDPESLAGFVINAWEGALLRCKVERSGAALDQWQQIVFSRILA